MTRISVTINDVGAFNLLDQAVRAAADLTAPLDLIAGDLLAISDEAFSSETDPSTGLGWVPLKPSTLAQRAKAGHTGGILQRTGILRQRVQTEVGSSSIDVGVGSSVEYALVHQVGGTPNQGIPARPFIGASPDDLDNFQEILSDHITRGNW